MPSSLKEKVEQERRIGYSRLQYYANKFQEHYGLTLNEYRRKSQYDQPADSVEEG